MDDGRAGGCKDRELCEDQAVGKLVQVAGNGLLHDQPAFAACFYLLQPAGLSVLSNTSLAQSQPKSSSCGVTILKKTSFILGKFSKLTGSSAED